MEINKTLENEFNLTETQVKNTIELIDNGSTIPFIARYRKEVTGNIDDHTLRDFFDRLTYLRNLNERVEAVIKLIDEQGKLTDELKNDLENAKTLSEVEDLYRPYKQKRKTRASIAKEKGLEPVALTLKNNIKKDDFNAYLKEFINEEKKVNTIEDVLNGAKDIIAEEISDEAKYRKYIKDSIEKYGFLLSKEKQKDEKDTYGTYADFKSLISKLKPYQILAIFRGEKEKCLSVSLDYDKERIKNYILFNYQKNRYLDIFKDIVDDALTRLILPSVENEIYGNLFLLAEDKSLEVFKKNLKELLLYPPLKDKDILSIDPGFRTGCKYALVSKNGIPLEIGVVNITANSKREIEEGKKVILALIKKYNLEYVAIGNGTASRESEAVVSSLIKENKLSTKIFIVNESGASVYSASALGEKEFPDLSVEKRSAISLARRVIDPLAELCKIEPKAIGVGQYQHDLNQTRLNDTLKGVVEDSVNEVGVKLNTASVSLLSYVSGINSTIANNIYDHLKENGPFKNREELKKVKKLGPKAYEQCAGFLRIEDGNEPLDNTGIHPESYKIAKALIKEIKLDLVNDDKETRIQKLDSLNKEKFLSNNDVGKETLDDIIDELKNPGRDIRDKLELVELNNDVKDIKDLKVGMILNGTIRNIMDFGMFIDINVHQDALCHISEVSKNYVSNIYDLYNINEIVKVKVISVDIDKKRIGVSLKQVNN